MNASAIEATGHQADYSRPTNSSERIATRPSTLAISSPGSRGESSWLTALLISLALLALWAWLRLT